MQSRVNLFQHERVISPKFLGVRGAPLLPLSLYELGRIPLFLTGLLRLEIVATQQAGWHTGNENCVAVPSIRSEESLPNCYLC